MSGPELRRLVRPRALPAKAITVTADSVERDALAKRFEVSAIKALNAHIEFETTDDAVQAVGRLIATVEQPCAVTRENFIYDVKESLALRFVPAASTPTYSPDEEVELDTNDLDEIEYEGEAFDLGEAIAQSLGLAIDPYRAGPRSAELREKVGIVSDEENIPSGPLAEALAALKKD